MVFRRYIKNSSDGIKKHRLVIVPIITVWKVWQEKVKRDSQMKHNIDIWHAQTIFHPKIRNPFTHTNYASPPGPALGTAGKSAEVDFGTSGLLSLYLLSFLMLLSGILRGGLTTTCRSALATDCERSRFLGSKLSYCIPISSNLHFSLHLPQDLLYPELWKPLSWSPLQPSRDLSSSSAW